MLALSVANPWALFIALAGEYPWMKRIENRDWNPHAKYLGQRIAIHATKTKTDQGEFADTLDDLADDLSPRPFTLEEGLPLQVISAHCETWLARCEETRGQVVATAILKRVHVAVATLPEHQLPWFNGPYALEFSHIQAVRGPVVRGMLGFWKLPADYAMVPR